MNSSIVEISPELLQRFVGLIRQQTGIETNESRLAALERTLRQRMTATRLSPANYLTRLRIATGQLSRDSHRSPQPVTEWDQLMPLITTGESFFFRDHGQFQVLRTHLLPKLILQQLERQRLQGLSRPSLRIWSAGCSSGEEVYSLTILVTELLPNWQNWDLQIHGTDINPVAIAKAKQGLYTPWSFRQVEESVKLRYFQRQQQNWQIRAYIQDMTRFQVSNLLQDPYPNLALGLSNLDLILCRNVFIYCNRGAIAKIVDKFNATLRPGGYLLTGHTELQGIELSNWSMHQFPESLVYQQTSRARSAKRLIPLVGASFNDNL